MYSARCSTFCIQPSLTVRKKNYWERNINFKHRSPHVSSYLYFFSRLNCLLVSFFVWDSFLHWTFLWCVRRKKVPYSHSLSSAQVIQRAFTVFQHNTFNASHSPVYTCSHTPPSRNSLRFSILLKVRIKLPTLWLVDSTRAPQGNFYCNWFIVESLLW